MYGDLTRHISSDTLQMLDGPKTKNIMPAVRNDARASRFCLNSDNHRNCN